MKQCIRSLSIIAIWGAFVCQASSGHDGSIRLPSEDKSCVQFARDFFLKEMDGVVGENAPEVIQRPKYVAVLLKQIRVQYPSGDDVKCLSEGLDSAIDLRRLKSI